MGLALFPDHFFGPCVLFLLARPTKNVDASSGHEQDLTTNLESFGSVSIYLHGKRLAVSILYSLFHTQAPPGLFSCHCRFLHLSNDNNGVLCMNELHGSLVALSDTPYVSLSASGPSQLQGAHCSLQNRHDLVGIATQRSTAPLGRDIRQPTPTSRTRIHHASAPLCALGCFASCRTYGRVGSTDERVVHAAVNLRSQV